MKKGLVICSCVALLVASCKSEYTAVYKHGDTETKYEYAKECFANGSFQHAIDLLEEVVTMKKGTEEAQECLYMLAMAQYCNQDFESASATFKKYGTSYPRGIYAEPAAFYVGQSLYQSAPEPRLDQSPTKGAITAYQQFIDLYPDSKLRAQANDRLYELHSNYTSCIITAQNCLKDYPYCKEREAFMVLIMKSKFHLAENSSEEKRLERYRDAEDECYGFINEFPESKNASTAQKYIEKCKKVIKE